MISIAFGNMFSGCGLLTIVLCKFFSQREIPSSNIALHSAHCARNLQKCEHCGDMVPRKHMDEHYDENHAPVCFQILIASKMYCFDFPNIFIVTVFFL